MSQATIDPERDARGPRSRAARVEPGGSFIVLFMDRGAPFPPAITRVEGYDCVHVFVRESETSWGDLVGRSMRRLLTRNPTRVDVIVSAKGDEGVRTLLKALERYVPRAALHTVLVTLRTHFEAEVLEGVEHLLLAGGQSVRVVVDRHAERAS